LVTVLVALLLGGLVLPLGLPASAQAQAAEPRRCPSTLVPATAFTDTLRSTHRAAIDCSRWWDLTEGRTATSYAPDVLVTRGQTAAMLWRLLDREDRLPSPVEPAGFLDTDGHLFEVEIDALATLGILAGRTASTFEPNEPITREQLASVLTRTIEQGFGSALTDGPLPFVDVRPDGTHARAIAQLTRAGVIAGTTATTFSPGASVTRGQVASFLTRTALLLEEQALLALPAARPAADDAYASRMRAAWVHLFDDTLKTRAGIVRMVDELVAADATAVIAQVARRHDAYYDSEVLTRTVDPRVAPDFDVLDVLLEVAHAAGLEVHAWYGVAPTWHRVYEDLPQPAGWLYREHGPKAREADRWVTREYEAEDEDWSDYLDPGVPAVQDHVAEVVAELVERYPVDGIHLDYVRYSGPEHGYNPIAVARFQEERQRTGIPAPDDREWSDWRRQQTRAIVQRAAAAIDASDRDVTLSAAVITWGDGPATADRAGFRGSMPYWRTLQDWDGWVRNGDLDLVLPMNYFRDHLANEAGWLARWQRYQRALVAEADSLVVSGPGGYLNHPDAVQRQIQEAMRLDGAAVYSYQQPTLDGSRAVWQRLADARWGYAP
jgi:uncharacterized lipoprotein YddW (UPF0748 family)